jgi:acetyl esterase/lipase
MGLDVQAAVAWLMARTDVRAVAIVGASFGATAAAVAAGDMATVRGLVLVSPAADYRGVRIEGGLRKYGARPLLLVASSEDPYALRTIKALNEPPVASREQRVSTVMAHGTALLSADPEMAAALVDWLRRTLVF